MPTIKGTGVVFGTGTIGTTIAAAAVLGQVQSISVSRASQKAQIKGIDGAVRSNVYHGFEVVVQFSCIPSNTTIAGAKTEAGKFTVQPGTSITFTDDFGSIIDGDGGGGAGVYNVDSAVQNRTVDGVVVIDITASRGDESVDSTTLVT